MTKQLRFLREEIETANDGSVLIPVDLILSKLPKPARVKAEYAFKTKSDVDAQFTDRLSKINWKSFAAMNCENTKSGYRSVRAYAKLLESLAVLVEKYDSPTVNEAISRIKSSEKAVIPYLKAITKSISKETTNVTSPASDETDQALRRAIRQKFGG